MLCNDRSQNRIRTRWTAIFVWLVAVALLLSGCGAPAPKVYRVGILSGTDDFLPIGDGFKAEMTKLGYVEGKNITYEVQSANADVPALDRMAKKFVDEKVDMIVTIATEASLAAKKATQGTNIPVVFIFATTEGTGLINSVREPGGNITGVRYPGPDLAVKRFEMLLELAPQAKRILLPYQKGYLNVVPQLEAVRPAAAAAGVTLIEVPVSGAAELEADLQARAKSADMGFDAILFIAEPLAVTPDALAVTGKFAAEHKMLFGGSVGTVFGLVTDNVAVGKQAAPLADKIFKGAQAGTIPVVSAEGFLQVNYKMAQELGVTVPEGLLNRANQVIR